MVPPICVDTVADENGTVRSMSDQNGMLKVVGQAALEQAGLERARTGDEQAFREIIDPYRRELLAHCYRMLGSLTDAEDMLQETLLSAWRGLPRFEGRSSLRSWLYRIATNTCLNAMRSTARQVQTEPTPPFQPPEPTQRDEITWLPAAPGQLARRNSRFRARPGGPLQPNRSYSARLRCWPAAHAAEAGGYRSAARRSLLRH